jgi:hypothetical protein
MGLTDSETALAAGVTAAILSPRVRAVMRRGAVYGVAGVLKASDIAVSAGKGAVEGARDFGSQSKRSRSGAKA